MMDSIVLSLKFMAGPIFTEWYWDPIFAVLAFILLAGPYILAVSLVAFTMVILVTKALNIHWSVGTYTKVCALIFAGIILAAIPVVLYVSSVRGSESIAQTESARTAESKSRKEAEIFRLSEIAKYCSNEANTPEINKGNARYAHSGTRYLIYVTPIEGDTSGKIIPYSLSLCPDTVFTKNGQVFDQGSLREGDILTLYSFTENIFWANRVEVH